MLDSYKSEVQNTIARIRQIPDVRFSFLYATDMHVDYAQEHDGIMRQCEAMVSIANTTDMDCIILGGDLLHGVSSKEDSLAYLQDYAAVFSAAHVPTFVTRGNHDDNGYHNEPWTGAYDNQKVPYKYVVGDYEWSRVLLDPLARGHAVHDPMHPDSTYYYVDDPAKKMLPCRFTSSVTPTAMPIIMTRTLGY